MNNEIKEILDKLKYVVDNPIIEFETDYNPDNIDDNVCPLISNECKLLLDCITNLQQIEQEHKKINGELREENGKLEIALQNLQEDYDRRIKENEKLKENLQQEKKDFKEANDYCFELKDYKSRCEKASNKLSFIDEALENDTLNVPLCITKINSALNILQNGSEKNEC